MEFFLIGAHARRYPDTILTQGTARAHQTFLGFHPTAGWDDSGRSEKSIERMETEESTVSIASAPQKEILGLLRSDAITLALGTLLSYTVVFVYEAGACSYFEIPKNLIVLNLSTGLAAASILFVASFGLIFYTRATLPLTKISSDAEYRYWGNRIAALFFAGYLTIQPGIGILPVVLGSILTWLGVKVIRRWNTYQRSKVAKVHAPSGPVEFIEHRLPPKAHFWIALRGGLG